MQAIALIPTMTIGMRWFPHNKGMAMGVVVGGFGGGAFIFNQIQTAILNPDNTSPQVSSAISFNFHPEKMHNNSFLVPLMPAQFVLWIIEK